MFHLGHADHSTSPTASTMVPTATNSSALAYSKVQYDALKSDLMKYVLMAGGGGLVVGFLLAKVLK